MASVEQEVRMTELDTAVLRSLLMATHEQESAARGSECGSGQAMGASCAMGANCGTGANCALGANC